MHVIWDQVVYVWSGPEFLLLLVACRVLTGMSDREAVGGLQVIHVVVQMEGFLTHVLVGVVELHSESKCAMFLHR